MASSCVAPIAGDSPHVEEVQADTWIQLFNGEDLDGWRVKVAGYEVDDNSLGIFSVQDGVIRVSYDNLETFNGEFGHLFYDTSLDYYRLRVEYRFLGEQVPGGPGWAWRNSGVMLHGQHPETMTRDQSFPVSIEAQMLGGPADETGGIRTTANLCTPGTHVEIDGKLHTPHCLNSNSLTHYGDEWATIELEVRGGEQIRHWMDDTIVLSYEAPQLDPNDADAKRLIEAGAELPLTAGFFSLQAESHPMEIRSVELQIITD
ncbi:MAG: hypothetical protein ACI84E_002329 [Planctomycetota bacterium]|jgi:hypothetical protein